MQLGQLKMLKKLFYECRQKLDDIQLFSSRSMNEKLFNGFTYYKQKNVLIRACQKQVWDFLNNFACTGAEQINGWLCGKNCKTVCVASQREP